MKEQETATPEPATDGEHRQGPATGVPTNLPQSVQQTFRPFTPPAVTTKGWQAWSAKCFVYIVGVRGQDRPVKIGVAEKVSKRLWELEAGNPLGLREIDRFRVPAGLARQVERRAHEHFAAHAIGREWFDIDPTLAQDFLPAVCAEAEMAIERFTAAFLADPALVAKGEGAIASYNRLQDVIIDARARFPA